MHAMSIWIKIYTMTKLQCQDVSEKAVGARREDTGGKGCGRGGRRPLLSDEWL